MTGRRLHVVGGGFDERRNTSRVFAPPPAAVEDCLQALAAYRRSHPRIYAHIEAGSPPILTQDDHVRWFGEPHQGRPRPRRIA